ncbi:MAG: SIS domain-containing protein [Clostridiaceae bacterium]|nr:SIS domain-containing protein [Clostridiaceae bacterium]
MNFYLRDVLTQPQEMKQAIKYYRTEEVRGVLEKIGELKPRKVIFSGMGSSHFCAIAPSVFLRNRGIASEVVSAGQLLYYENALWNEDILLVLISQSGESAEIVRIIEKLPEHITVAAITNQAGSTLERRGNYNLNIHVSPEKSVTTRTYLGSAVLTQLIAEAVCGNSVEHALQIMEDLTESMGRYLKSYKMQMEKLRAFAGNMNYLCILGRGYGLETVQAGALFMREVLRFPALDFDCAEFRHGPMEMVQSDFYGIVLAPAGVTQDLNIGLAADIGEKGGNVILITDTAGNVERIKGMNNIHTIQLPVVEEWAAPFLEILPIQLLANMMAEERKLPVGEFRWGSKIMRKE